MARCPFCGSEEVYISRSQDHPVFRLALLARVRCHDCADTFFTLRWLTRGSIRVDESHEYEVFRRPHQAPQTESAERERIDNTRGSTPP